MAAGPGGARPGADAGEDRGTGPGGATTAAEARMTPGMDPTLARIDLHRHLDGSVRLELRFSPCFMAEAHRLDPVAVSGAVLDGIEAGGGGLGGRTDAIRGLWR